MFVVAPRKFPAISPARRIFPLGFCRQPVLFPFPRREGLAIFDRLQAADVNDRVPVAGAKRVLRGGSWKSRFASLRATTRNSNVPNYSCNDLGFRIVCECD